MSFLEGFAEDLLLQTQREYGAFRRYTCPPNSLLEGYSYTCSRLYLPVLALWHPTPTHPASRVAPAQSLANTPDWVRGG